MLGRATKESSRSPVVGAADIPGPKLRPFAVPEPLEHEDCDDSRRSRTDPSIGRFINAGAWYVNR